MLTSPRGANRVYAAGGEEFVDWIDAGHVEDRRGRSWRVSEEALLLEGQEDERRPRLAAHRMFWFAWYAQYPETRLIH